MAIAPKDKICYLCGSTWQLELHHIYPGSKRKMSDKYNAVVWLCKSCHTGSKNSVHQNEQVSRNLKKWYQSVLMNEQGWTTEQFIKVFGRNYL